MFNASILKQVIKDEIRLLTFRPFKFNPDYFKYYLTLGLLFTWLAGVGRYWDNPRADLWQYLGLGSVVYVFVFALILWGINKPLRPKHWQYKNVLVFVCMTSPPAVLYAIPVERFVSMEIAQLMNVWFLAIVALWRVALLVVFLKRVTEMTYWSILVASLLPLTLIVSALSFLNLEHVVFNIMAGLNSNTATANDAAYHVLVGITVLSIVFLPVLLIAYVIIVVRQRERGEKDTV